MLFNQHFQKKETLLEEEDLVDYFYSLASAVNYLHSHGIAHFDIRPESVKLTKDLNLKLDNFALAVRFDEKELIPNNKQSNLYFRAPEFFTELKLTPKVDVWAIGVVFYYLSAYRLPFYGESEKDQYGKIMSETPLNLPMLLFKKHIFCANNRSD